VFLGVVEGLLMIKEDTIELRWVFQVVRRWLWLIVGGTLLGAASAFLISSQMPPVYSASVTLLVQSAGSETSGDYRDILASERLASTYSRMLKGRPVMEGTISQLEMNESPEELVDKIEVKLIEDTQLIRLSVEHSEPVLAARLANTVAQVFIAQIRALQDERYADSLASMQEQIVGVSSLIEQTQAAIDALATPGTVQDQAELVSLETILAGYRNTHLTLQQNYQQMRLTAAQSTHNVIIAEQAVVPASPTPRRKLHTVLAAVVSGALAIGVSFLLEHLDDTVKTPDDISRTLGLPTLGTIDRLARGEEELVVSAHPFSPVAEAYRILCTNIRFSSVDKPIGTLLVTSPNAAEGKSLMLANLAVASARAERNVVAVDADLRRPRLHELFSFDSQQEGLTKALVEGSVDGRLQPSHVDGLRILPSGRIPPNPAELVGSHRMMELLQKLVQQSDVVLVDSPPVLPVADATMLARVTDGVLLVVYAGKTRREAARRAVDSLRQVGANLVGVALNAVPTRRSRYYYYRRREEENIKRRRFLEPWEQSLTLVQRLLGRKR
jgi:non-specific protein-tyrosine kinase